MLVQNIRIKIIIKINALMINKFKIFENRCLHLGAKRKLGLSSPLLD